MPPSPTVSVVVAALDAEHHLPLVLEGLPRVDEIIVVTGGGTATTVPDRPGVTVVRQTRSGKGNALVCGVAASSGDIVITLDAGGCHDPGELVRHVRALEAGAEATHGSRFRSGGGDLAGGTLDRFGNALACRLVNLLLGTRYTDLDCGFNGFWRGSFRALELPGPELSGSRPGHGVTGDGPEIDTLITIRMAAQGLRVVEVPCTGYPSMHGGDHRRRPMRTLRIIVGEWSRRRRLAKLPSRPARHDAETHPGYASASHPPALHPPASQPPASQPPAMSRPTLPAPRGVRPAAPQPDPYVAGERTTGRHALPPGEDDGTPPGIRRSGIYDGGAHERVEPWDSGVHRTGVYDTAVRRSGLYDTGVHRLGVYDSGVHRTEVYDSGVHELPEAGVDGAREVGGGRRRLDAADRARRRKHRRIPGEKSTR